MLVAAGCQKVEYHDLAYSIEASSLVDFEDPLGRPRINPAGSGEFNVDFYQGVVGSGQLLIDYDPNVAPSEYSKIAGAATDALVTSLIPLYVVPHEEWSGEGQFRVIGFEFLQTCVEPSSELIAYFDKLNATSLQ